MKTAKEIEQEFRADLKLLIKKYDAEIEASDHYTGYSECGEDIRVMVSTQAVYVDNECVQECADFNIGTWITADNVCEKD